MKKTILITGSNGLLGQKLVDLLSKVDHIQLIATAIGENRLPNQEGYIYQSLDITDNQQVNEVFASYKPQIVIHTAAMTNVDTCESDLEGCERLNVKAVEYIVQACEKQGSFLCHLSTDFIFDGADGPYDEEAKPNPISIYGESKLKAEKIIQAAMKQSLHYYIPKINEPVSLSQFIKSNITGQKFIAHCEETDKKSLKNELQAQKDVVILIGPEGDFSVKEIQMALDNKYIPVSLGETRLRTETAAIVACHSVVLLNE